MKVLLIKEYKIQLVYQFLYFLLFYIASEFTSADIIFNIYWKKIFVKNFHFITNSPKPTTLLLSVTKAFCWCSLNLENFWFYTCVVVLYDLISPHKWLYVTSYSCPWIKYLRATIKYIIKYILKCWERSVKRKSNISFRVIFWSKFSNG